MKSNQNEKDEQPKLFVLPARLLLLLIIHPYEKEASPLLFSSPLLFFEKKSRQKKLQ